MRLLITVLLAGVVLASPAASGAVDAKGVTPDIRSGNWRVAVSMEIPKANGPATGPLQYERCLSAEDTKNLLMIPPGAACSIRNSELTKESLTWSMQCMQGEQMSAIDGKMEFHDTRVEARILTVTRNPPMRITTRMSGRYIGPCMQIPPKAAPSQEARPGEAPARGQDKIPRSGLPRYKED